MATELYIGLMSGTSMDGVDGVLIDLSETAAFKVLAHQHKAFSPDLRQSLFDLNTSGQDELHRAALAGNAVSNHYADVVETLLQQGQLLPKRIAAIGAHGQTVRHRPGEFDGQGYTLQLLNPALLAERAGVDVVCDFRSRDLAAGGQGAPLVPAFHRAAFSVPGEDTAVVNLGGIANISFLFADGRTSGHDCGPGNVLLDIWCGRHLFLPFDDNGQWAAGGKRSEKLLCQLLQDEYFLRHQPKSTGRDHFNSSWLDQNLSAFLRSGARTTPQDVQCTLAHLTAEVIARDLHRYMPQSRFLSVCGGGALNSHLLQLLQNRLSTITVQAMHKGCVMHAIQVEAAAFAWLAQAFLHRRPANCPSVTGSRGHRILGALYPA